MTQFTRWVAVAGMSILLASPVAFGRGFGGGMRGGGMGGARGGYGGGGMGGARGGMGGGGMGGPRGGYGGAGMRGGSGMAPRGGMAGQGRTPGAANRGLAGTGQPGAMNRAANEGGAGRYPGLNNANGMHQTPMWSNGNMANRAADMRNNFNHHDCFGAGWYGAHPGAWYGAGLATGAAWDAASWGMLAPMWGIASAPMYYDYGNTVAVQGDSVYVNGDNVGTPAQYSQQATSLAQAGQQANPPAEDQWTPLGVFALESPDDQSTDKLFQLAVDQSGVIRGNYYDAATDTTTPVAGSVDSKTQRAAWTIGDKQDRVFDTGIYNLTKEQAPILVHTGDDQTQQLLLVRMRQKAKPANSLQNP